MNKRFILLGISVMLLGFSTGQAAPTPRPAMTVTTSTVSKTVWADYLETQGIIAPWQEAIVSTRVANLPVAEIHAAVGDWVKKGELLARLDERTIRADIAQAEANIAQAAANLKQANSNRDRTLALKPAMSVSEQTVVQAITQAEAALAQKAAAEAALAILKLRLEDTRALAPDDGIITGRNATLGQVSPIGAELFRMIRQGRLEWRAELTASQLQRVQIGMNALMTLPDGSTAQGRVRQIAPILEANTRLGWAYIDIQAGSHAKAAMYTMGKIELQQSDALIVPSESVVIRDGRTSVFTLLNERVRQIFVTTGRRQANWIEIIQGLQVGEQVVVRGAGFLNEGDMVKIVPTETARGEKP